VLAQRGIAVRLGRGRYDAARSTTNYIRHLREQAARQVGTDPAVDGVAANVEWKQASTALLKARYERGGGEVSSRHHNQPREGQRPSHGDVRALADRLEPKRSDRTQPWPLSPQ
jgi:hypothetical protein